MAPAVAEIALGLQEALRDAPGLSPALHAVAARIGACCHAVQRITWADGRPRDARAQPDDDPAGAQTAGPARAWALHGPGAGTAADLVSTLLSAAPRQAPGGDDPAAPPGPSGDGQPLHVLELPLIEEADGVAGVVFYRRGHQPAFQARDLAVLEAVRPHLRRVLAAEARRRAAEAASLAALAAGLDALPDGVALLDMQRRMVFANAALRAMATRGDGLALGQEGPEVADPAARQALHRAVTAALAAAKGQMGLLASAGGLALPRPSGGAAWLVRALPMGRDPAAGPPGGFRGAMLLVSDAERRAKPSAALLGRMFGLTPAEASLAAALAAGRPMAEHARRRGVSIETARTHMRAIRRKTGCRRQAELAALFARLPG